MPYQEACPKSAWQVADEHEAWSVNERMRQVMRVHLPVPAGSAERMYELDGGV